MPGACSRSSVPTDPTLHLTGEFMNYAAATARQEKSAATRKH